MDKCRKNVHGIGSLLPEGPQEVLATYILVFIHLYRKARGQRVIPFAMQASSSREYKETRWATSCCSGESSESPIQKCFARECRCGSLRLPMLMEYYGLGSKMRRPASSNHSCVSLTPCRRIGVKQRESEDLCCSKSKGASQQDAPPCCKSQIRRWHSQRKVQRKQNMRDRKGCFCSKLAKRR